MVVGNSIQLYLSPFIIKLLIKRLQEKLLSFTVYHTSIHKNDIKIFFELHILFLHI